jgi:hypothetical protein
MRFVVSGLGSPPRRRQQFGVMPQEHFLQRRWNGQEL